MKYFILTILLTLSFKIFSQSIDINSPHDSLIKKFHIKTITTFYSDDSTKEELDNIWKFNSDGKLISFQIFDNEDPSLAIYLYFYNDNILIENWQIGTWFKNDTLKTTYFYDKQNRVIKELIKGKVNGIDYSVKYNYINDYLILKVYNGKGNSNRTSGIDSLIFNPDKSLKDLYNTSQDLKISYKYNQQKQLISETHISISDSNYVSHYRKYFYEKDQLIKEIFGWPRFGKNEKDYTSESIFYYSVNGLINRIETPGTITTYNYEYFK